MERKEQIGFGFPVACARHPDRAEIISEPGQLPSIAPLGMSEHTALPTPYLHPLQVAVYFHAKPSFHVDISANYW
jgi:hypothetical protein